MPPLPIEEAVKTELPLVSSAVLIGDQRKFLSMLLTLKVGPPGPPAAAFTPCMLGRDWAGNGQPSPREVPLPPGVWAAARCWDSHRLGRLGPAAGQGKSYGPCSRSWFRSEVSEL